ncbi:hypothetical protein GGI25_002965 [Coemansia spiralis]|uniref:Uncharacterized protein n=2 Tax=Coemansia TaxID=4863 RepID=A0A9W8KYK1_9FUNG|nr:hypothetical protein EDC05_002371 [Coemansia umbellata]KAJ2623771.1 hypothetical protein GGI26_002009 [Coemansia sp. RSA 1358]KAJ2677720.1 hypothetical protein GGI25_002965 [Coemansia spiralis]
MIPASLTDTLSLSEPISLAYDRFDSIFDLSATPEAYSLNTQEYNPFCKDYYTNSMLPNAITEKTRGNGALEFNHTFHSANDLQQHPSRQFVSDLRQQQQPSLFARTSPLFHTRGSNYTPSHIARESGFYGVLAAIDNSGLKIN